MSAHANLMRAAIAHTNMPTRLLSQKRRGKRLQITRKNKEDDDDSAIKNDILKAYRKLFHREKRDGNIVEKCR